MSNKSINKLAAGATHTPKKWQYELHIPPHSADGFWQVLDAENVIANVDPNEAYPNPEDLCCLIAAAPELLSILKSTENWLREYYNFGTEQGPMDQGLVALHNDIVAAIARAEGR